jgi:hypothetical protein
MGRELRWTRCLADCNHVTKSASRCNVVGAHPKGINTKEGQMANTLCPVASGSSGFATPKLKLERKVNLKSGLSRISPGIRLSWNLLETRAISPASSRS